MSAQPGPNPLYETDTITRINEIFFILSSFLYFYMITGSRRCVKKRIFQGDPMHSLLFFSTITAEICRSQEPQIDEEISDRGSEEKHDETSGVSNALS